MTISIPLVVVVVVVVLFHINVIQAVPKFTRSKYVFSVEEEQPVSTSIDKTVALDSTTGFPSPNYVYSIGGGVDADAFEVDNRTGVIRNAMRLDREAVDNATQFEKEIYEFDVTVQDSVSNASASAAVSVSLVDINDHRPLFASKTFQVDLLEDVSVGDTVFTLTASDPDKVQRSQVQTVADDGTVTLSYQYDIDNGHVLYGLESGNDLGYFSLNADTGLLTLTSRSSGIFDVTLHQTFNLTVNATDGGGLTDKAQVVVEVIDANDHSPVIHSPRQVHAHLSEDTPPGVVIVESINVTDGDFGKNADITFEIESGNLNNAFSIDPGNGKLITVGSLDRDSAVGSLLLLVVTATDGGVPSRQDSMTVSVNVSDVNDNAPDFGSSVLVGSVTESASPATSVFTAIATDPDNGVNGSVQYHLLGGGNGLFSVETDTGLIRTAGLVDREATAQYILHIAANDLAENVSLRLTSSVLVNVTISDINDNVPQFESLFYVQEILDNVTVGQSVLNVKATDIDAGVNAEIRYETLRVDEDAFGVDSNTGDILVEKALRYERRSSYDMNVRAWDKGTPPRFADTSISIQIHNVNENPPRFRRAEYNVTLYENMTVGTTVLQVSATDVDPGPIGELSYHVSGEKPFDHMAGSFDVNLTSGDVFVNSTLDWDTRQLIGFQIVVRDGGFPQPFEDVTQVWVELLDLNDVAPYFPVTPEITVMENLPGGTFVGKIVATDPDSGDGGIVTYEIVNGTDLFNVNVTTGNVWTKRTFDREQTANYTVSVKMTDEGDPRLTSYGNFVVHVGDVDDNGPVYLGNLSGVISEGTRPGVQVILVRPNDFDIGINARFSCNITSGNEKGRFTVEPTTCKVTVTVPLDQEDQSEYILGIRAEDAHGRSNFTYLHVTVGDANDNSPVFSKDVYVGSVSEGALYGYSVLTVFALDADKGINAEVTYFMTDSRFNVNASTGEVFHIGNLDRETIEYVIVSVFAKDGAPLPLTGSALLNVTLLDANDIPPVFTEPLHIASMSEGVAVGQYVTIVSADDQDIDFINSNFTYVIEAGEGYDWFAVDPFTGVVTTQASLDREVDPEPTFFVTAKDTGSPQLSGTTTVRVTLYDINDSPPKFDKPLFTIAIPENSPAGSSVGYVNASDLDEGSNATLSYRITKDSSLPWSRFSINASSGLVTSKLTLNREWIPLYHLEVQAEDHGFPSLSTRVNVSVVILDTNDNFPVFEKSRSEFSIPENALDGDLVGQVVASDKDIGTNAELRFHFSGGRDYRRNPFFVDPTTGNITKIAAIDREMIPRYELEITVTDLGSPSLKSSVNVTVIVADINDNDPVFLAGNYSVSLRENMGEGTHLLTLVATDGDTGENAAIEYVVLPSADSQYFEVQNETGVLKTATRLDREKQSSYLLKIMANNSLSRFAADFANVSIQLEDLNDESPHFEKLITTFEVSENLPVGNVIFRVPAIDDDEDRNGTLTFRPTFESRPGLFILNTTSGDVVLNGSLNREEVDSYVIGVEVFDMGRKRLNTSAIIYVNVTDENDEPPKFLTSLYYMSIPFTHVKSTKILDLKATDKDTVKKSPLTFTIVKGNPRYLFSLAATSDPRVSELRVNGSLLAYLDTIHNLTILVSDGNRTAETNVVIDVYSTSTVRPVFLKAIYAGSVKENEASGKSLTVVAAAPVGATFGIVSGDEKGRFALESSGEVRTAATLDYEERAEYHLGVSATNSVGTSYCLVIVSVRDQNDHGPEFVNDAYDLTVAEATLLTDAVVRMRAVDGDEAEDTSRIKYTMTALANGDHFRIDPSTGDIYPNRRLDFENGPRSYNFTVTAANHLATPVLQDTADVRIAIAESNDNSPEFEKLSFTVAVKEDKPVNSTVLVVTATDADAGYDNSLLTYTLSGDHRDTDFLIDSWSGEVTTGQPLDRERQSLYSLTVTATDGGNPARSTSVPLIINIIDLNDNAPVWEKTVYSAEIYENAAVGASLIKVRATDRDHVAAVRDSITLEIIGYDIVNGLVKYSIAGGDDDGQFSIDSSTGEVTINGDLDREAISSYVLTLNATDGGGVTSLALLKIKVLDVNDNPPAFSESVYNATMPENGPAGTTIFTVVATDDDEGVNGEFEFSIKDGTEYFDVNASTGVVFTKAALNRELVPVHRLVILATDYGNVSLSSSVYLDVAVLDLNDNGPVFNQSVFSATVKESAALDSFVVKVVAEDADFAENGTVLFEMVAHEKKGEGKFKMEETTGIVRVARKLDYEESQSYKLKILATDQTKNFSLRHSAETTVIITVEDVNDNSPQLTNTSYSVSVDEDASTGTYLFTAFAVDRDNGSNADLSYSLSFAGDSKAMKSFSVDPFSGEVTTKYGLDREDRDSFNFSVVVTDRGSPARSSSSPATVTVLDINDETPKFDFPSYYFSAFENSKFGTPIGQIGAKDGDIGENSKISYSLQSVRTYGDCLADCSGNSNCSESFETNASGIDFAIDSVSGFVSVMDDIDRENKSMYALMAFATDQSSTGPRLTGSSCIFVTVLDRNDQTPEFGQLEYDAALIEDVAPGKVVTTVQATDDDEGTNAEITYSIVSGTGKGLFSVDSISGAVTSLVRFDRESGDSYFVVVQATDNGSKPLSSTAHLRIQINDINDNPPVFLFNADGYYRAAISENQAAGLSVLRVSATDKDLAENADLSFSILPGDGSQNFKVNSTTGVLTTTKPLDREAQTNYNLTILAADGGILPKVTPAGIFVTIVDENDNDPVFAQLNYTAILEEELPSGSYVSTLSASDKDEGSNARLRYLIERQFPVDGGLAVDSSNGTVTVARPLDREVTDRQVMTVFAIDEGKPARTATVEVTVYLLDENDNSPLFSQKKFPTVVSEAATVGTVVFRLEATDLDADVNNSAIRYMILSGNEERKFRLDPVSWKLLVDGGLDRETKDLYQLDVVAQDLGTVRRNSTALVIVNVQNENDNRPIFTQAEYVFDVAENDAVGASVGHISAQDIDNQNVSYSLVAGEGFLVEAKTGDILTNQSFDYEKIQTIRLTARAVDEGLGNLTFTDVNISIHVVDLNDNSPRFHLPSYNKSVAENVTLLSEIIALTATDADSGENARLSFHLNRTLIGPPDHFAVEETSGVVSTVGPIDREMVDFYRLEVIVRDHGRPARSASTIADIIILDVNDNLPVANVSNGSPRILENESGLTQIAQVSAVDDDIGLNSRIVYSILSGDPFSRFTVNSSSGIVRTTGPLDREQNETYLLVVGISDVGSPPLRVTELIQVTVLDLNDNSPLFSQPVYVATVSEDTIPSSSVFMLSAYDPDKGINSELRYHVSGGNGDQMFAVDETTGTIITKKFFDRELKQSYVLNIQVSDRGTAPRTGSTQVNITISDVNDNKPHFVSSSYDVSLPEASPVGQLVAVLVATDADEGSNAAVSYRISLGNGDDAFFIDADSGRVFLNRSLDYEKRKSYVVTVVVMDEDFSDTASLTVNVEDSNDHAPVFDYDRSVITVPFDVVAGSQVAHVVAADVDFATGSSALAYAIAAGNEDSLFAIGKFTGTVSTPTSLTSQVNKTFSLRISATDGEFTSDTDLIIQVTDTTSSRPVFSRSVYELTAVETMRIGSVVGKLTASGAVDFNLTASQTFSINSTGHVRLISALDFESKTAYGLTATAIASGGTTASTSLRVDVIDVNDNAPVFETDLYVASVSESSRLGSSVIVVKASDADSAGPNRAVEYVLHADPSNWFYIDKSSGLITTKSAVDRERYETVYLNVTAVNSNLKGFTAVQVNIKDVNDNSPAFALAQFTASLSENAKSGTPVTRLTADDPDSDLNGKVTYSISSATVDGVFAINDSTGVMYLRRSLNRQSRLSLYTLGVTATDFGSPFPRQGSTVIYITIEDVNKHPPVFDRQPFYNLAVPESNVVDAVVGVVRAVDPDTNSSIGVSYAITSGNAAGTFRIVSASGALVLSKSLDYENTRAYNLTVVATDTGFPPLNSTSAVHIEVTNLNDHVPVFTHPSYQVNVTENIGKGTPIIRILATDPDTHFPVTYIMTTNGRGSDDEPLFSIGSSSGVISTESALDREHRKSHTLRVTAIDSGFLERYSTSVDVVVDLLDVNDNAPAFVVTPLFANVSRFLPGLLFVAAFHAVDPDEFHGSVKYSIVTGNDQGFFAINSQSGNVTTTATLDETARPLSNLTIRASDGNLSSSTSFVVHASYSSDYCYPSLCVKTEALLAGSSCHRGWRLGSDGKYCILDYCLGGGDVVCPANRSCVNPSTPCDGDCLLFGQRLCPSNGRCFSVGNPSDFCDANKKACFEGFIRTNNDTGGEICRNASALKPTARSCTNSGFVYCIEKDVCVDSGLPGSNPCRLCPIGFYACPDTLDCVRNLSHCCPGSQVYCNLTDRCINETDRCVHPNAAPLVKTSTIFLGTVTENRTGEPLLNEGVSVELLMRTSGQGDVQQKAAEDDDGDLVSLSIVGKDSSSGRWEYAVCTDRTACRNSCCPGYTSDWTAIGDVSEDRALLLPLNARIRLLPSRLFQGSAWLKWKAWDGSLDGVRSETRRQVVRSFVTVNSTETSAFSSVSSIALALIHPTLFTPSILLTNDLHLPSVLEDTSPIDNMGSTVLGFTDGVDLPYPVIFDESKVNNLPPNPTTIPNDHLASYFNRLKKVNGISQYRLQVYSTGTAKGVAVAADPKDVGKGRWQISPTGKTTTWTYFDQIAGPSHYVLLSEKARMRFLPENDYSGEATILLRAWDGAYNMTTSTLSPEKILLTQLSNLKPFSYGDLRTTTVSVISVPDEPIVFQSAVHLEPIPYRIIFEYGHLFTATVAMNETAFRRQVSAFRDYLVLILKNLVDIKRIEKASPESVDVSFEVQKDLLNFTEASDLIQSNVKTLSIYLKFNITDVKTTAAFGSGAGCTGAQHDKLDGAVVSDLVAKVVRDGDGNRLGAAFTSIPEHPNGVWQYTLDRATSSDWNPDSALWLTFPPFISPTRAFLLSDGDRVRFLPRQDYYWRADEPSAPVVRFRAWDGSIGGHAGAININTDPFAGEKLTGRFSYEEISATAVRVGCDGVVGSAVEYDACCICGGNGAICTGCDDKAGSNLRRDGCDVCGGNSSSCIGCDYIPFSRHVADNCSICRGSTLVKDCSGTCYGAAAVDDCGICSGGTTGRQWNADVDCAGVCKGTAVIDDCGDCTGGTMGRKYNEAQDCRGKCNGGFVGDAICGLCQNANSTVDYRDCTGRCFGSAALDFCGHCYQRSGDANSTLDACGVCGGDGTTCNGCDGIAASGKALDRCGECGGDDCHCFKITDIEPKRGPASGGTRVTVHGAGFIFNISNPHSSQILDSCGGVLTDTRGNRIRARCKLHSPLQQWEGNAELIDQRTLVCTTPDSRAFSRLVSTFKIHVSVGAGIFNDVGATFTYDDTDSMTVSAIVPESGLSGVPEEVSLLGSNFVQSDEARCLLSNFFGCVGVSGGYVTVPARFNSSSEYRCVLPVFSRSCQFTVNLTFDGQASGIVYSTASRFTYVTKAPAVVEISFSDNANSLLFQWDKAVEMVHPFSLNCTSFFSDESFSLAGGETSTCVFENYEQLSVKVLLGDAATVKVGSTLRIRDGTIRARNESFSQPSRNASDTVVISPLVVLRPVAVISSSSDVPVCGNFFASGKQSYNFGYGSPTIDWSIATADSSTSHFADLQTQLFLQGLKTFDVALDSDLFVPGVRYYLELQITSVLGKTSDTARLPLYKSAVALPHVTLRALSPAEVVSSNSYVFYADAKISECSNATSLTYKWSLIQLATRRDKKDELVDFNSRTNVSALVVPANTFLPGVSYKVQAVIADGKAKATVEKTIIPVSGNLQIVIEGGGRDVSGDEVFTLDAGRSVDFGRTVRLANFTWECYWGNVACFDVADPLRKLLTLPNSRYVRVDAKKLQIGETYRFVVRVTKDERSASAETQVRVSLGRLPVIKIHPIYKKVLTDERLAIRSDVLSFYPIIVCRWEVEKLPGSGFLDLSEDLLRLTTFSFLPYRFNQTDVSTTVPVFSNSSSQTNLVLKPDVLTAGLLYRFKLTATNAYGIASATIDVRPDRPPTSGTLRVAPSTGTASTTLFTLRAGGWSDVGLDLPLLFRFGALSSDGSTLWLTGKETTNILESQLPWMGQSGELRLVVEVYDQNGAVANATATVALKPSSLDVSALKAELTRTNSLGYWSSSLASLAAALGESLVTPSPVKSVFLVGTEWAIDLYQNQIPFVKSQQIRILQLLRMSTDSSIDAVREAFNGKRSLLRNVKDVTEEILLRLLLPSTGSTSTDRLLFPEEVPLSSPSLSDEEVKVILGLLGNLLLLEAAPDDVADLFYETREKLAADLCRGSVYGQSVHEVSEPAVGTLRVITAVPGSDYGAGENASVDFGEELRNQFIRWNCTNAVECQGVCIVAASSPEDWHQRIGKHSISGSELLHISTVNALQAAVPEGNISAIRLIADVVSLSLANPTSGNSIDVSDLTKPIEISFYGLSAETINETAVCLYRSSSDDNSWRTDDDFIPKLRPNDRGQVTWTCSFKHNSDFTLAILPKNYIEPSTAPPTTNAPTTVSTTEAIATTAIPTTFVPPVFSRKPLPSPTPGEKESANMAWIAGPAIVIVLFIVGAVLLCWFLHRRKQKIGVAEQVTLQSLEATDGGTSKGPPVKERMKVVHVDGTGDRREVCSTTIVKTIRLRELRNILIDEFDEKFKTKSFYFLTKQLRIIEPEAETMQFVRMAYEDDQIFVRDVQREDSAETKMHFCICGRVALFECSECQSQGYCSPECQVKHWNEIHSKECSLQGEQRRRAMVLNKGARVSRSEIGGQRTSVISWKGYLNNSSTGGPAAFPRVRPPQRYTPGSSLGKTYQPAGARQTSVSVKRSPVLSRVPTNDVFQPPKADFPTPSFDKAVSEAKSPAAVAEAGTKAQGGAEEESAV